MGYRPRLLRREFVSPADWAAVPLRAACSVLSVNPPVRLAVAAPIALVRSSLWPPETNKSAQSSRSDRFRHHLRPGIYMKFLFLTAGEHYRKHMQCSRSLPRDGARCALTLAVGTGGSAFGFSL
jgi:hypothetical protein